MSRVEPDMSRIGRVAISDMPRRVKFTLDVKTADIDVRACYGRLECEVGPKADTDQMVRALRALSEALHMHTAKTEADHGA